MKINIDNEEYELNVEKAKKLGVLEPVISLKEGDLYSNIYTQVIVATHEGKFILMGAGTIFSAYNKEYTEKELFDFLKQNKYKFIKNIKLTIDQVSNLG